MERALFSENDKHIIAFNSPRIHAIIIGTESIFHNDHFNVFVCEMRSVGFLGQFISFRCNKRRRNEENKLDLLNVCIYKWYTCAYVKS